MWNAKLALCYPPPHSARATRGGEAVLTLGTVYGSRLLISVFSRSRLVSDSRQSWSGLYIRTRRPRYPSGSVPASVSCTTLNTLDYVATAGSPELPEAMTIPNPVSGTVSAEGQLRDAVEVTSEEPANVMASSRRVNGSPPHPASVSEA